MLQFIVLLVPALAFGAVLFSATIAVSFAVHVTVVRPTGYTLETEAETATPEPVSCPADGVHVSDAIATLSVEGTRKEADDELLRGPV